MKINYEEVNKYNAKYILKNMKDLTKEEQKAIDNFRKTFYIDDDEVENSCGMLVNYRISELEDFLLSEVRTAVERERERIRKELHEIPVVLVDTRFNSTDKPKYEHGILYEDAKKAVDSLK
jgi:hypothetical protein